MKLQKFLIAGLLVTAFSDLSAGPSQALSARLWAWHDDCVATSRRVATSRLAIAFIALSRGPNSLIVFQMNRIDAAKIH